MHTWTNIHAAIHNEHVCLSKCHRFPARKSSSWKLPIAHDSLRPDQRRSWTRASPFTFHSPVSIHRQPYAIFFKLSIFTFHLNYFTHCLLAHGGVGLSRFFRKWCNRGGGIRVSLAERALVTHDSNGATQNVTVVDQQATSLDFFQFQHFLAWKKLFFLFRFERDFGLGKWRFYYYLWIRTGRELVVVVDVAELMSVIIFLWLVV